MPSRSLRLCLLTSIGAVWLVATSGASAQTPADLAAARDHFRTAQRLEAKKDWSAAADELRAALRIKETPGLRYHLAYCQEQLASYSAALIDYERAQQLLAEGQKAADVSRLLGPAIERVKAMLGELTVVSPDGGTFRAFLDGNPIEVGTPTRLDPGLHILRAVRDEREQRHEVVVAAQEQYRIELSIPAPEPPAPLPPASQPARDAPPDEPPRSIKLPLLIAEGVVTAAGLGIGLGFTVRANQASDEADRALADIDSKDPARQCGSELESVQSACSQLSDLKQREFDARHVATAGFIGAGTGAVLLLATWLLWPDEGAPADASTPRLNARFDGRRSFVGVFGQF